MIILLIFLNTNVLSGELNCIFCCSVLYWLSNFAWTFSFEFDNFCSRILFSMNINESEIKYTLLSSSRSASKEQLIKKMKYFSHHESEKYFPRARLCDGTTVSWWWYPGISSAIIFIIVVMTAWHSLHSHVTIITTSWKHQQSVSLQINMNIFVHATLER